VTREFVVHVPKEDHDLLRLGAEVTLADSGLLDLDDAPAFGPEVTTRSYVDEEFSIVEARWDIKETSWVRRLIRGDSVLWSRWLLAKNPSESQKGEDPLMTPWGTYLPEVFAYVDTRGGIHDPWGTDQRRAQFITDLSSEYGVMTTHTHAELSLFDGAASPASTR
jgi:hypothetical protein